MRISLSDNYILSLVCVTVFLIISDMFSTTLNTKGGIWGIVLTTFITLGGLVLVATLIRTISPKVRNSIIYQILMLFDVTELARIIRRHMNQAGRTRQVAMVAGTIFYGMSVFLTISLLFFGMSVMNMDNGLWSYTPAMFQEITVSSLIMLTIFVCGFVLSLKLIAFGFYRRWESDSVKQFARDLARKQNSDEPPFWDNMNKKQKYQYATVVTVTFALLMIEVFALGFIMQPAMTYGTSLESEANEQVLNTFGTWTNAILADIGVLTTIGLTAWVSTYILNRLRSSTEEKSFVNSQKLNDAKA